jgi:hypothetical protein
VHFLAGAVSVGTTSPPSLPPAPPLPQALSRLSQYSAPEGDKGDKQRAEAFARNEALRRDALQTLLATLGSIEAWAAPIREATLRAAAEAEAGSEGGGEGTRVGLGGWKGAWSRSVLDARQGVDSLSCGSLLLSHAVLTFG